MDPNPIQPDPIAPEAEDRRKTFARRALIQAGWALPAAAVIGLPRAAGAASTHNDAFHDDQGVGHTDTPLHNDGQHGDGHVDNGVPHADDIGQPFAPHADSPPGGHNDSAHNDFVGGPNHGDI